MERKGISPVVAVVVLIGIAVMLGGLVSSWISGLVSESSQQSTCAITTLYTISGATLNESSGKLTVTLKNIGKNSIYNFSMEVDNGSIIEVLDATSPADMYNIDPGRTQYIITNTTHPNITKTNITSIDTVTVLTQSCPEYSPDPINVENI